MSATPSSVVPIFATPFGALRLPDAEKLNPTVAGLLSARAAADTGGAAHASNPHCYTSGDDLLNWTDEPLRKVTGRGAARRARGRRHCQ